MIYMHYIQIRAWPLPQSSPVSLANVYVHALILYINACHKDYTHNALLCTHIPYDFIITSPFHVKPSFYMATAYNMTHFKLTPVNSCAYESIMVSGPRSKLLYTSGLSGHPLLDVGHLTALNQDYSTGGTKCLGVCSTV